MLTLTPNDVQNLIAAADAPEASAERQRLTATLGEYQPLPGRHWREFPIQSVVASLVWLSGHQSEALSLAMKSVGLRGLDDLARNVFESAQRHFYDMAMLALHQRRPDMARTILATPMRVFAKVLDFTPERSLLDLLAFTEAVQNPTAPRVAPSGRSTVVTLSVWGQRFVEEAAATYLPCCLAAGNLPALAAHGTVYLRIHTRAEDVEHLRSLPVVQELSRHAQIEMEPIPAALVNGSSPAFKAAWNRLLYAAMQYADVMFARSLGADFMIGVADLLMSNTCYAAAKRHLMSGYQAVVVQMSRVVPQTMRLLEAQGYRHGESLDLPSDTLYRASMEAVHPFILQSFMKRSPSVLPVDPIHFYFTAKNGFSHRSLQLNPFAIATGRLPADLKCDFHSVDAHLLADVLAGLDRDKACYVERQMPGEMYAVSLDDEGGVASFGNFELSPAGAVKSILKWANRLDDIDHFQWSVRQRFEYPLPEGVTVDLPRDSRNEDEAVAEIVALLEQSRAETVERLKGYQEHGAGGG